MVGTGYFGPIPCPFPEHGARDEDRLIFGEGVKYRKIRIGSEKASLPILIFRVISRIIVV